MTKVGGWSMLKRVWQLVWKVRAKDGTLRADSDGRLEALNQIEPWKSENERLSAAEKPGPKNMREF